MVVGDTVRSINAVGEHRTPPAGAAPENGDRACRQRLRIREEAASLPFGSGEVRGEGLPVELHPVAGAVGGDGAAVAKAERFGEEPFQSESVEFQP